VSTQSLTRAEHLVTKGTFKNLNNIVVVLILNFLSTATNGSVTPQGPRGSEGFAASVAEVLAAELLELGL